jgi:dTMP kinase
VSTDRGDAGSLGPDVQSLIPPAAQRSAYRGLFRNRNYRLWFGAALASSLGDWAGLVALQTLVTLQTEAGSRLALFALGGIMMARLLPSILVGPLAGVFADRYDRKRLMVVTNVTRGVIFVGIAFSGDLITLFTLTFAVECLSLLFLSAKDAALPNMVAREHLQEANQLNLLVTYGTLPLGAVLATSMIPVAAVLSGLGVAEIQPTTLVLLVNAATFVSAGVIISRLRLPPRRRRHADGERPGMVQELREGIDFIRGRPLIRSLILGVVGVFFGAGVVVTLGPEFVRTSLGGRSSDWFTLITFVGGGLVTGIIVVPAITRHIRRERLFPLALAVTGGLAAFIATVPTLRAALGIGFALGLTAGISFVTGYTLLHTYTEDAVRARTFAAFYTGTRVSMFAALAAAPFLAGAVGRGTVIVGNTVITMSGVRIMMLLGGLLGMFSAVLAGRGILRAMREADRGRTLRLPVHRPPRDDRGVFIAFEGVEGAGKSTQVRALVDTLRAEGHDVVVTREPGGAPVAERIRAILLDPNSEGMHPRTEALLYAAARAEHANRVLRPALDAGKVVVCDRFLDSSLAYQGFGRGLGEVDVAQINRWGIEDLLPDVTVLLNLDPDEGLHRVTQRSDPRAARGPRLVEPGTDGWEEGAGPDRLEREDIEFHRRVARGYLTLAKHDRHRFEVVDASADPAVVARQVRSALHKWLPLPADDRPAGSRQEPGREGRAGKGHTG